MTKKPNITIPKPLRGIETGTWAHNTITIRLPEIARRVLKENDFPSRIQARIHQLVREIPESEIRPIHDTSAEDANEWEKYIRPHLGSNWLQAPWFFAEHYFYRRILEAIDYFQAPSGNGTDPFAAQKEKGLLVSTPAICKLVTRYDSWLRSKNWTRQVLQEIIHLDLWGNQADLSLWPAEGEDKPDHGDIQTASDHLLVDHSKTVAEHLLAAPEAHKRVDFLIDNAGFELVNDLVMADFLLTCGNVPAVRLHVKAHPTFVSDATANDVWKTVNYLINTDEKLIQATGLRLREHLKEERLQLRCHHFWTSPRDGWDMPETLRNELGQSGLIISKGDAHYRRLMGDRHWPFHTPFEDVTSYYPAPLVALRTLKSELIVGLPDGQAKILTARDPEWLVNGRWGVIQSVGCAVTPKYT